MPTMSGRERVLATMRFEPTDVLPVQPYLCEKAAPILGISVREYCTSPSAMAEAQVTAYRIVGHDIVCAISDQYYIAQAFGGVYNFPEDETPDQHEPPCREPDDVFDLEVPNPYTDGRMPMFLEAIDLLRRELGGDVAVRAPGSGVVTLASYLLGTQRFLLELGMVEMETRDARPDVITRCFELATEAMYRWGLACQEAGADLQNAGDSLASPDVISPRTYARWVYPYQRKLMMAWKERGIHPVLHVCGNTTPILPLMAETGAEFLELDYKVDLRHAKEVVGQRCCLIGNIDPVRVLFQGTPEEVHEAAEACITAAGGRGYVLGSGCAIPRPTPIENLGAMVAAARAHPNS